MAGFKLIETYLSSESEDEEHGNEEKKEMQSETLVFNDDQCNENRQLPLPACITSWGHEKHHKNEIISSSDENQLDKHQGRVRSFEHERGNWTTLIYITYSPSESIIKWMSSILETLSIKGNLIIEGSHMSLTRTLILKFHWIESFTNSLKRICRNTDKLQLNMMNVKLYCNEAKTRTFIGIECQSFDRSFALLMESLNKLLAEYELAPFYENASYHISFFWTLGDKIMELQPFLSLLNDSFHKMSTKYLNDSSILVSEIHCRIGNKKYVFPFR